MKTEAELLKEFYEEVEKAERDEKNHIWFARRVLAEFCRTRNLLEQTSQQVAGSDR